MNKKDANWGGEAQDIENLLAGLRAKKLKHERELQEVNANIKILQGLQTKSYRNGKGNQHRLASNRKKGIPDNVKEILQEKELHVDEILRRLQERSITTSKTSLAALLWNYSNNSEIFKKVGPNTYDLIEKENLNHNIINI